MSALAATIPRLRPTTSRSVLNEADAICEISRQIAYAQSPRAAIDAAAQVALRVTGIYQVQMDNRTWGRVPKRASVGTARSGAVVIVFDLHTLQLESPIRFAKFLEQQGLSVYELFALQQQRAAIEQRNLSIHHLVMKRKANHRACGIVSRHQRLDFRTALWQMRRWSREQKKGLYDISQEIIRRDTESRGFYFLPGNRRETNDRTARFTMNRRRVTPAYWNRE